MVEIEAVPVEIPRQSASGGDFTRRLLEKLAIDVTSRSSSGGGAYIESYCPPGRWPTW